MLVWFRPAPSDCDFPVRFHPRTAGLNCVYCFHMPNVYVGFGSQCPLRSLIWPSARVSSSLSPSPQNDPGSVASYQIPPNANPSPFQTGTAGYCNATSSMPGFGVPSNTPYCTSTQPDWSSYRCGNPSKANPILQPNPQILARLVRLPVR